MPDFFAKFTNLGLTRLAEAQATYTPLVFTDLAVGDGNGSPITPSAGMTALVNERARVSVNAVDIDPTHANRVRVEGLIPAATGGFTIREAGLFNGAGELIAVGNFPDIYKAGLSDGALIDCYIRILLNYENPADAIELTVDTSVVMATRAYVDELHTMRRVLDEDFTGQAVDLSKWTTAVTSGGGSVAVAARSDAMGAAHMDGSATGAASLATAAIYMGSCHFDFRARMQVENVGGSGRCFVGITGAGGDAGFLVDASSSTTVLRLSIGGFTIFTDVSFTFGSNWFDVQMVRNASGFFFYANGTLIQHAPLYAPTMDDVAVTLSAGGPNDLYVDRVTLLVPGA
jgi:hypothetical protein